MKRSWGARLGAVVLVILLLAWLFGWSIGYF